MKFSNLEFASDRGGISTVAKFENGYGLSVVKFPGTYGYPQGLYECALVEFTTKTKYKLSCFPGTENSVIGFCTEETVTELLQKAESL